MSQMSPAMMGAWFGAALGLVSFAALRWVAARQERNGGPQGRQTAAVLRLTAFADLIAFPVVGYFAAPLVLAG
jgi:hypothetical protein